MPYKLDDEDDAFDEDGLLRDGGRLRVSMFAMDGMDEVQRVIARSTMRLLDGLGRVAGHRPGFVFGDRDDGKSAKQTAYDGYERDLTTAWQRDRVVERDPMGRKEANYTKRKGRVTKRDPMGREAAEYEREPDDSEWEIAGPLSDAQSIKDAAYREYEAELACRWKR